MIARVALLAFVFSLPSISIAQTFPLTPTSPTIAPATPTNGNAVQAIGTTSQLPAPNAPENLTEHLATFSGEWFTAGHGKTSLFGLDILLGQLTGSVIRHGLGEPVGKISVIRMKGQERHHCPVEVPNISSLDLSTASGIGFLLLGITFGGSLRFEFGTNSFDGRR